MNESLRKALLKVAEKTETSAEAIVEAYEKSVNTHKELMEKAQGDIMHGDNAGFGAEARTEVLYKDEIYSMINRESRLLSFLPGNHGQILSADSVRVTVYGELENFSKGTEMVGNPVFIQRQANDTPKTDKAEIKFQKFQKFISVTVEELTRNAGGESAMYRRIEKLIVQAFAKSIETYVINGDSDATATNINGIPLPAWTGDIRNGTDGLRKIGIANGVVGDGTAYSRSTLADMYDVIDDYTDDGDKLLWVFGNKFGNKLRFDATYSTQDVFGGVNATNTRPGFVLAPEGIVAYQTKDMPKFVDDTGKVDGTTPANNDHVGGLLVYRPCVQYAYGISLNVIVHEMSDGLLFDCTGYFGFDIANKKAGLGATVAYGLAQI